MKVGMIFECGPQGADRKVCVHFAKQLDSALRIVVRTADNKRKLVRDCGILADQLINSGCARVIIIWDLYPSWTSENPCRKEDCEAILSALNVAGVDHGKVELVCVENELETWLMTDIRGVRDIIQKMNPTAIVKTPPKLQQHTKPKALLNKLFFRKGGKSYDDLVHAEKIAMALTKIDGRLGKLQKKSKSFRRFALKVADIDL